MSNDAPLHLAMLGLGLILIQLFKRQIARWGSPVGDKMDPVTYYRALAICLTVALLIVDFWRPLNLLKLYGINLW